MANSQLLQVIEGGMSESLEGLFQISTMLTNTIIPSNVMENYCSGRPRESAAAMTEINSSTHKTTASGRKNLNKFKYADMDVTNRPKFVSWSIDEKVLEEIVKGKYANGSYDEFMLDLIKQLNKLRSIIYFKQKRFSGNLWAETRCIQPMMQLFVTYLFRKWNVGETVPLNIAPANIDTLTIKLEEFSVNWSGKTDLYCYNNVSEGNIYESKAIIEMKVPFGRSSLHHSKALQPKQQLLGQSVGLFKRKSNENSHTLSYLTDIFAISLLYHVKDVAYLTKRVTDPRAFCLRLLLMCCVLTDEEWGQLLPVEQIDVDLKEDENEDENEDEDAHKYSSSQQQGETIGSSNISNNTNSNKKNKMNNNNNTKNSKKSKKSNNKDNNSSSNKKSCLNKVPEVRYGTFDLDEEEAHDRRLRDITYLLRWDAKCKGFNYLGEEELDKHNGNVKVNKLSTWK